MVQKIKKIRIKKFRGIPDFELTLDGKSLVIKGDNGTGKSSIVDSFEFFFTGSLIHLTGTKKVSLKSHGPHVNYTHNDVEIEVTFQDNTLLKRTFNSEPEIPTRLDTYFKLLANRKFILHRSEILEFILSKPSQRYIAIGNIIGIESLDNIELEFKKVRDELKGKVDSHINFITQTLENVRKKLNIETNREEDILEALNVKISECGFERVNSMDALEKLANQQYKEIIKIKQHSKESDEINKIKTEIERINIPTDIIKDINGLPNTEKTNNSYTNPSKNNVKTKVPAEFLKMSIELLQRIDVKECPLCEQNIEQTELLKKLQNRIEIVYQLTEEASRVRSIKSLISDTINEFKSNLHNLNSSLKSESVSNKFNAECDKISDVILFFNKVKILLEKEPYKVKKEIANEDFECNFRTIEEVTKNVKNKIIDLEKKFEFTDSERKVLDCRDLINLVIDKWSDCSKFKQNVEKIQKQYDIAEKIYTLFSNIKKEKIQKIYDDLIGDINVLYSKIHPNEKHERIELSVDTTRRASTDLKIDLYGKTGLDPRSLASEGHLDSLGICIFLAFFKKFNHECPLMIFDDILTTIDSCHRERIAKILLENFGEKQLIITTHDGIWFEQLRSYQKIYCLENNFRNIVITGWDLDAGPKILDFKPDWELINEALRNEDKKGAGGKGRSYLEWILKELCERMQVSLLYKKNALYTVSELFDPFLSRMNDLLDKLPKDNEFKKSLSDILQTIYGTRYMTNLLAHDNIIIEEFHINEVRSFCESINNLYEQFLCPSCHLFLSYDKIPKEIRCLNAKCDDPFTIRLGKKSVS